MKIAAAVLAAGWTLELSAGWSLASLVNRIFGSKVAAIANGKVVDPEIFIHGRMFEALSIVTAIAILAFAVVAGDAWARRAAWYRFGRGVYLGIAVFAALNASIYVAEHTVLFWMPFYGGAFVDNYAQWQIKRHLLPENPVPRQVILLGNSQVCSNFDEKRMNLYFRNKVWTTELHQSGIGGLDLRFIVNEIGDFPAFCAVTYVSPPFFSSLPNGHAASRFAAFREVPDLVENGGWHAFPAGVLETGLVGHLVPLFHHNESFSQRILGGYIGHLAQMEFDASLESDLDIQARRRAPGLKMTAETEAQRRGFDEAIGQLAARCQHVIIVEGTSYPLLDELRPDLKAEVHRNLAELQKVYSNVTIVPQDEILPVTSKDFMDLIHFNEDAQRRFSDRFSEWMDQRFSP